MTPKPETLVERLRSKYSHRDTANFNVLDFLSAFGSPLDALMYARLFWPLFIEIDDMVFRAETVENDDDMARLIQAFNANGKDRPKTEMSFNLLEIPSSIFGPSLGESTDEEDRAIANLLCEMWRACLTTRYPSRSFRVEVWEAEETGGEVGVVFFQDSPSKG